MSNLRWEDGGANSYYLDGGTSGAGFTWGQLTEKRGMWCLHVWRVGETPNDSHWDIDVAEFSTLQEAQDVGQVLCALELAKYQRRGGRRNHHG